MKLLEILLEIILYPQQNSVIGISNEAVVPPEPEGVADMGSGDSGSSELARRRI